MNTGSPSLDGPHPEVQKLRRKLCRTLESISTFGPSVAKPPIVDASVNITGGPSDEHQHQEAVHGLRSLRDAVRRDLENIEKFFDDPECASLPAPSTNAPYLISVWHEVLLAPPPVTGIWSAFSEDGARLPSRRMKGGQRVEGIKVDVVADGGKRWIRVNTTKNSRLLAEFRELDSYLTDSEDDVDDAAADGRPSLRQDAFDNTILRMARPLIAAANANPLPGTGEIPAVTMQLTRLDPNPSAKKEYDKRLQRTIDELKTLGLDVRLGERDDATLDDHQQAKLANPSRLQPTSRINLDLSILIALVSDLTHAPLPQSVNEAEVRFTPSASYIEWKKARLQNQQESINVEHIARPSRALSMQAVQETVRALWEEMHDRLSSVDATVEFWTTPEAVDRCLKIVSKIGGPDEKRRARAMLPSSGDGRFTSQQQEVDFWQGSRYPCGYVPLFPIHVFPSTMQPVDHEQPSSSLKSASFFTALSNTCRIILAQDIIPDPRSSSSSATTSPSPAPSNTADDAAPEVNVGEIPRAAVTRVNHRLTGHTVQTMLWGATRGWTTLTANKTSVKAILREMKTSGNAVWERTTGHVDSGGETEVAALWVVEPRSLAEGMRADFQAT